MREQQEDKTSALRITNQFRSGGGMAYDLKCDGVRLTLLITERGTASDPGEWRIEARGSLSSEQKANIVEWGATRADALAAIGRAWATAADTASLRVFDWDAVANTLRTVRAI
jgi:hypothetical protein